ncbi:hypothetical protein Bca4012_020963 [Brassica carinata]
MSQRLCKILFRNSIATGEVFPLESEVRGCDECTTGDKVMIELRDSGGPIIEPGGSIYEEDGNGYISISSLSLFTSNIMCLDLFS